MNKRKSSLVIISVIVTMLLLPVFVEAIPGGTKVIRVTKGPSYTEYDANPSVNTGTLWTESHSSASSVTEVEAYVYTAFASASADISAGAILHLPVATNLGFIVSARLTAYLKSSSIFGASTKVSVWVQIWGVTDPQAWGMTLVSADSAGSGETKTINNKLISTTTSVYNFGYGSARWGAGDYYFVVKLYVYANGALSKVCRSSSQQSDGALLDINLVGFSYVQNPPPF